MFSRGAERGLEEMHAPVEVGPCVPQPLPILLATRLHLVVAYPVGKLCDQGIQDRPRVLSPIASDLERPANLIKVRCGNPLGHPEVLQLDDQATPPHCYSRDLRCGALT